MNKLYDISAIPHPHHKHQTDEVDLIAIALTLWRGRLWIALAAAIACFLGGFYAVKIAVPQYPANAVVALELKHKNVANIESVLSDASGAFEEINTEVEVIRSRYLAESLVKKLNLIIDPEFNVILRKPSIYNPIFYVNYFFDKPEQKLTREQAFNAVVDAVTAAISVSNIRQSLAFSISISTDNPEKSALIVNALAGLYIQDSLNKKLLATETASNRLSKKADELKLELEGSETQIMQFSDSAHLISAEALGHLSIQLKEMRIRISDVEARQLLLKDGLDRFERAMKTGNIRDIVSLANDSQLMRAANELRADSISQAVFDMQAAAVLNKMGQDLNRINKKHKSLRASEKLLKAEVDIQSSDLAHLQQLRRVARTNGLLYESFFTRLKETIVQQGLQESDSRLLSSAVPRLAASPNTGVILALSTLLGSMFGGGFVLLRGVGNNTFYTVDDLAAYTGCRVMGSIPKVKNKGRKDVLAYINDKPMSVFAESFRNLRTSVLLSDFGRSPQVIMVTSSVPDEGKTTQALILAHSMSKLGKEVLVVEGDVRKHTLSEYLNVKKHSGFLPALSGEAALEEAVFRPHGTEIDILLGEDTNVNAADIFTSVKFADFITMLRKKYDYIIIDTAPVLIVPDARIIGQHADIILYSVLWNGTSKTQVKQGIAMLQSVGLRVNGLVFSKVDNEAMRQYGYAGQFGYDDVSGYYVN
jgi:capsular exopolysaccharide synthesis family protein